MQDLLPFFFSFSIESIQSRRNNYCVKVDVSWEESIDVEAIGGE